MDIIVDRPKLVRVVLLYLNNNFGDLIPKKDKDHPNSVFYLDSNNEVMIEYDEKYGDAYVHHDNFWSKLESLFHLNALEVQSIMKVWLKETYKLGNLKHLYQVSEFRNG